MDQLTIHGGIPLRGEVTISGAKNAALPLMTACLLSDKPLTLKNLPRVTDILSMANLLATLGVEVTEDAPGEAPADNATKEPGLSHDHHDHQAHNKALTFHATTLPLSAQAPYDLVRKMRASVLVLGPLLARNGYAKVSLPGGCAIGTRPVDLHIKAMEKLGAETEVSEGYLIAKAPRGLRGGEIDFPTITVGGTENAIMAAVLAKGTTRILNAACEPEIIDLCHCLQAMGAKISGGGTNEIVIEGVSSLNPATHSVLPDRIETGTYMIASAITDGTILLKNARLDTLPTFRDKLTEAGIEIVQEPHGLRVQRSSQGLGRIDLTTAPYPGFPTDLQAQTMALLCLAPGASLISEVIFENRFMHVPELLRMGADITLNGHTAMVRGIERFRGAEVMATDLRASVSLVLAALAAEGKSTIRRVYHLDRGYESVESKLRGLGAQIDRVKEGPH